jgi:hypothetical protein
MAEAMASALHVLMMPFTLLSRSSE